MSSDDVVDSCPACGGAGGGPFGRAGGAWDTEDYVCPRCKGTGISSGDVAVPKPGLTKTRTPAPVPQRKKAAGDPS